LEWDRRGRRLWPRREEPTVWAIFDARGREVDGEPEHVELLHRYAVVADGERGTRASASWEGGRWAGCRPPVPHPPPHVRDQPPAPSPEREVPGPAAEAGRTPGPRPRALRGPGIRHRRPAGSGARNRAVSGVGTGRGVRGSLAGRGERQPLVLPPRTVPADGD